MIRNLFLLLLFMAMLQWECSPDQSLSTGLENLAVSWQLQSNQIADVPRFRASFTLTNKGNSPIEGTDWSMYFNQTPRDIIAGSINGPVDIERVNGELFQLKPTAAFSLPPGDSLTITYEGAAWLIKETDAPIGLYLVKRNDRNEEQIIPVAGYKIWPFERPEQYTRHTGDQTPYPDPAFVYDQNAEVKELDPGEFMPIIPRPKTYAPKEGSYQINETTKIYFTTDLTGEADFLKAALNGFLSVEVSMEEIAADPPSGGILLTTAGNINAISREAYEIDINENQLSITGKSPAAVFYAIQSLLSLIPVEAWDKQTTALEIPQLFVADSPRFDYRGMHLDLARNFNGPAAIKKLMDAMAFYKLNKLHLHLTDDEGWRLEIPGLPELTQVGAQRGHTQEEVDRLIPAYGSGSGEEPSYGDGYLSRSEFIELLQYATRRHIEVIPELNVPGHARAAIKSMEARYRRLSLDNDKAAAETFRLTDPDDRSEYRSVQYYADNVVCVCCEGTYQFYEKVVDEVRAMFAEAGAPLTTIHTGGDEVPSGVWTASPACEALIAQEEAVESTADLSTYFFKRINQILLDRELKSAGWEEVVMKKVDNGWIPHPEFVDREVIPYVWNNLWGNQDLGYRLANAGYPIVLCNVTNLYFDLAYNKDPKEPGYYWGGFVDTRKAFDFRPFDLFKSTAKDPMGNAFDPAVDFKDMEPLNPGARENILGIQAQLWSETIKGPDMLAYYYLPKMLGLAQRAWSDALPPDDTSDEAWERFANVLGHRSLVHLDYLSGGYNYRLPPPGAKIIEGKAMANVVFPGLSIRYTTDGSEPTADSDLYVTPVPVDSLVCFKTFDQRGRGSRMICVPQ